MRLVIEFPGSREELISEICSLTAEQTVKSLKSSVGGAALPHFVSVKVATRFAALYEEFLKELQDDELLSIYQYLLSGLSEKQTAILQEVIATAFETIQQSLAEEPDMLDELGYNKE